MPEQKQKTPDKANQIIFVLIALIIGIALGFAGGYYGLSYSKSEITSETANLKTNSNSDCEAKLEKAKKLFPVVPEMTSLFGTIKEINGNVITLETTFFSPFEDLPLIRKITVNDGVKIVKYEQKDQALYQKETADYQKAMSEQTDTAKVANPPMPFEEKTINFSDIKTGDQIMAEAGENIKTKTEFAATKITLQISPIIGAGVAD